MRFFHALSLVKRSALVCSFALLAAFSDISVAIDMNDAADQVKALLCKDGKTVDQLLDRSVRRRSQRDLGWRVFQDEDYVDVERAILINKGMEMRYRWRVTADGNITAYTERAKKLCDGEDD